MISASLKEALDRSTGNVVSRHELLGRSHRRRPHGNLRKPRQVKPLPGETTFRQSYSRGQQYLG